jgi:hypothetical protein
MTRTFEFMLNTVDPAIGYPADANRLVQEWMWYTLNDQPYDFATGLGFNGGLFDYRNTVYPGTLTYFGQIFKDYVRPLKTPYVDLKPVALSSTNTSADFTLTARVANLGNAPTQTIAVRLYAGDPAAGGQQVGSDVVIPSLGIRHTPDGEASFSYAAPEGLSAQLFCVVVDPGNTIAESSETNNKACYTIRLRDYTNRVFLPVILSQY